VALAPIAFVLLIVLAVVAVAVLSYRANQKRMKELQEFCLNRGWTYVASAPQLTVRWQGVPFNQGDDRKAVHALAGTWQGRPFNAFDYSYDTQSSDGHGGTSRETHRYGVVALGLPAYLPTLQVTKEGMLGHLAAAVGLERDIDLESEDFNRAFTVRSADPKFASDVLNPRVMEMLLAAPHLGWRIEGTDILSWESGRFSPVDVLQRLDHLTKVVGGVPSFVWHDHGYDPEQTAGGTGGGSSA
jgi:Protein of unknown function (DUF3137)